MRWYFLSDTQEQIPTTEDQIPSLVGGGLLRAQSLVWPEGAADWKTLGELKPELFTANHSARSLLPNVNVPKPPALAAHQLTQPLIQRYGWLVTSGGVLLVLGVCLLVVVVLTGMGLLHQWREQANNLESAKATDSHLVWEIARLVLLLLQGLAATRMGLLVIQAATRLRQGVLLGEPTTSESGLQALGKFFVLLTITILVTVLAGLIFWGFAGSASLGKL